MVSEISRWLQFWTAALLLVSVSLVTDRARGQRCPGNKLCECYAPLGIFHVECRCRPGRQELILSASDLPVATINITISDCQKLVVPTSFRTLPILRTLTLRNIGSLTTNSILRDQTQMTNVLFENVHIPEFPNGSVSKLSRIHSIVFRKCTIDRIAGGAFKDSTDINHMSFEECRIGIIESFAFGRSKGAVSVSHFSVRNSSIGQLDFDGIHIQNALNVDVENNVIDQPLPENSITIQQTSNLTVTGNRFQRIHSQFLHVNFGDTVLIDKNLFIGSLQTGALAGIHAVFLPKTLRFPHFAMEKNVFQRVEPGSLTIGLPIIQEPLLPSTPIRITISENHFQTCSCSNLKWIFEAAFHSNVSTDGVAEHNVDLLRNVLESSVCHEHGVDKKLFFLLQSSIDQNTMNCKEQKTDLPTEKVVSTSITTLDRPNETPAFAFPSVRDPSYSPPSATATLPWKRNKEPKRGKIELIQRQWLPIRPATQSGFSVSESLDEMFHDEPPIPQHKPQISQHKPQIPPQPTPQEFQIPQHKPQIPQHKPSIQQLQPIIQHPNQPPILQHHQDEDSGFHNLHSNRLRSDPLPSVATESYIRLHNSSGVSLEVGPQEPIFQVKLQTSNQVYQKDSPTFPSPQHRPIASVQKIARVHVNSGITNRFQETLKDPEIGEATVEFARIERTNVQEANCDRFCNCQSVGGAIDVICSCDNHELTSTIVLARNLPRNTRNLEIKHCQEVSFPEPLSQLPVLQSLTLRNISEIHLRPYSFLYKFSNLREVLIESCNISSIPIGSFSRMSYIEAIGFKNCHIGDIQKDSFDSTQQLSYLYLEESKINSFEREWLGNFTSSVSYLKIGNSTIREKLQTDTFKLPSGDDFLFDRVDISQGMDEGAIQIISVGNIHVLRSTFGNLGIHSIIAQYNETAAIEANVFRGFIDQSAFALFPLARPARLIFANNVVLRAGEGSLDFITDGTIALVEKNTLAICSCPWVIQQKARHRDETSFTAKLLKSATCVQREKVYKYPESIKDPLFECREP
ncbi:unnamed protein product [Cyprideis torosa]|uniref:Uncharacterized protein n=1 Tax=Cyprideis torosa TaxID=163714 RepID=A0A7R8ZMR5_9CRUS|nr:unnamed protein product [Cyprideis torosa]CAG0886177.1 unnamed protein product [Cyprideis torosa]